MIFTVDELLGRIDKNKGITDKIITIKITENESLNSDLEKVEEVRELKFKPLTKKDFSDMNSNIDIIYNQLVSPNIKDPELLKKAGCTINPLDIVEKIFTVDEIGRIADAIVHESGIYSGKKITVEIGEDK